jgi:RND family efflux transporter MFP subunit
MNQRVCVIAVFAALAAAACSTPAPEETETEAVVPVTTAAATRGEITGHIHATGLVTPAPGAELIVIAPEAARILEIPKAEGETVRRGDVLVRFEIPSSAAEAAKQQAEIGRGEARLVAARAAEARQKDLVERGVGARRELEDATRAVADAQADLADARAAATAADAVAARSVVRATFDGVVARRTHNPGDLVEAAAADAVLRIVDPRRLEISAQVPLADVPRIRVGAAARVVNAATSGSAPPLTVVSRAAATQEGVPAVPIRLAFKAASNFPVGTPLEVEIDAEVHRNVILVPIAAVVHEGEETAVFVAAGDKAQRRKVMVGLIDSEHAEISAGVMPGEAVIVSNQNGLSDDAKIATGEPKAEGDKPGEEKDER